MEEDVDDALSGCFLNSDQMRSIDSNPKSDLEFDQFTTDLNESESDASIALKTHLRKL